VEIGIDALKGKRIARVVDCAPESDNVYFFCEDGARFRMWHSQDCCESVSINDVVGDPADLIGLVVDAREESHEATREESSESGTWTFYIIQTDRGCVTLRWLGESNGYYSESVNFARIDA